MEKLQKHFHPRLLDINSKPGRCGGDGRESDQNEQLRGALPCLTNSSPWMRPGSGLSASPFEHLSDIFSNVNGVPHGTCHHYSDFPIFSSMNSFSLSQISLFYPSWVENCLREIASHEQPLIMHIAKMESRILAISLSMHGLEKKGYVESWGQRTSRVIFHARLQSDFFIFKNLSWLVLEYLRNKIYIFCPEIQFTNKTSLALQVRSLHTLLSYFPFPTTMWLWPITLPLLHGTLFLDRFTRPSYRLKSATCPVNLSLHLTFSLCIYRKGVGTEEQLVSVGKLKNDKMYKG